MATLEERIAAIRAKRGDSSVVRPSVEERVAAIRARREQAQAAAPEATPETVVEPVDPNSASSAIGRGVDQMQAAFGGALETVGEITDSEYLQEAGSQYREEQLAEAAEYGTPTISSYKQVNFEDPEQIAEYLKQMGLSALPGTATALGTGIAGAKIGSAAGPKGAIAGGILGAITSALPMNVGEVQNAIKEIDPEMKSPWASVLGGTAISALDVVGLTSIAKPIVKTFGRDVALQVLKEQGVAKEAAVHAVKGAAGESATEAAQEGIKAVAAAEGTDTAVNTEKLIENMINSAVGGGLVGAGGGGVAGAAGAISDNQYVAGTALPTASFEEGRKKPLNTFQRAVDALGSSSVDLLEPMARTSPEIRGLIRKFRPDMTGETASSKTIFEDHELMVGKWRRQLEEGLAGQDVDQAVADYLEGKSTKGSDALRTTLKDVLDTARRDGGLDVGQIQDYLPTRLDDAAIAADPQQFMQDIAPYVQDPQAALDNYLMQRATQGPTSTVPKVDRAVQMDAMGNWVSAKQYQKKGDPETFRYKFAQGTVPPEFGHLEKSRAFAKVPQKVLQKYTVEQSGSEVMSAIRDYLEGAAHRIAFSKEFGPGGEKLNFKIVRGVKEAQEAGYKPTKQEVDRMYDLLDAYNGMYHNIQNETTKTIQSVGMAALTMKTLPLTVLSSLVETLTPAIRGDVKAATIAIIPTISQVARDMVRGVFKTIPRTEFSQFAADANITLGASLNVASERLGTNAFGRGSAKAMRGFFLLNGLSLWTHLLSVYSAKTADLIYKRNLYDLASGVPVTSPKGANLANQLRSMGVPVYTNEDAQILYNPLTQSQRETANQFRVLAIRRFKDQTILQPNIADTPMWMSNGHLQWLAMLKRYPAAFGNIILPQIVRNMRPSWAGSRSGAFAGTVSAMFVVSLILFIGYLQDELKMYAKGTKDDDKRTEVQRAVDVVNSTLAPLKVSLMTDFMAAPRYGTSPVESVAGPAVGFVGETVKSINKMYDDPTEGEVWKYLYKQTPVGVFRQGREEVEEWDLFD